MNFSEREGVRYYTRTEPPPTEVSGYTKDMKDPYVWHSDFVDCRHRCEVKRRKSCGRIKIVHVCNLLGKDVTAGFCEECDLVESQSNA